VVLAAGCVFYAMTVVGGTASADPAPPSPAPSPSPSSGPGPTRSSGVSPVGPATPPVHLHLELSRERGISGTSFTATATGARACLVDNSTLVRAAPPKIAFEWSFGQEYVSLTSDTASASFTVPGSATPGAYAITASCGSGGNGTATATFTVTAQPGLVLSPAQGAGRAEVRATTQGFDACHAGGSSASQAMSWQWDGGPLQTSAVASDASTVTFEVPADSVASVPHTVSATCDGATAKAPFTVVASAAPALKLDRSEGQRGTELTASGTGFACGNDRVTLSWDGASSLADGPPVTFSVQVKVPTDSAIGQHTVVASCHDHPELTDSQSFTVITDTVGAAEPAALALAPARGAPRDPVQVTGDRFACNDAAAIELFFDGQLLANPSADVSGHFDTVIKVPADARVGSHTARAVCDIGSAVATAGFTVVPAATTAPTTAGTQKDPPPTERRWNFGWWLWVIFAVLAVLAVVAYRHWRKPPVHHVSATISLTSRTPLVSTHETPTAGERTHALRLQTRADPGIQTLREVDSDRIQ
jgi:hypothetical protein